MIQPYRQTDRSMQFMIKSSLHRYCVTNTPALWPCWRDIHNQYILAIKGPPGHTNIFGEHDECVTSTYNLLVRSLWGETHVKPCLTADFMHLLSPAHPVRRAPYTPAVALMFSHLFCPPANRARNEQED